MTSADLLLHPVRLRIVQAFLGDRTLTTTELQAELPDVPPASLYRHLARLTTAGVLNVVNERRVRGTYERTYALRTAAARMTAADIAAMTPEQHRQAFLAYLAGLIGDMDRYLDHPDAQPGTDGGSYQLGALWLDDSEFLTLMRELNALFQPLLANTPTKRRKRWVISTVLIPDIGSSDEPRQK